MKTIYSILAITLACSAVPAMSQSKVEDVTSAASAPGRADMARDVKVTATVTEIDKATRTVTLKGPEGKEFTVVAGPEVRNFDQIKVGSEVLVSFRQALALELKKGGGAPREIVESSKATQAKPGAQPSAAAAHTVTAMADVTAIDPSTQVVTLRGPKRTVDLRVPDPKQFKMIAVGDQVQVTYTEAVAVSVEPKAK